MFSPQLVLKSSICSVLVSNVDVHLVSGNESAFKLNVSNSFKFASGEGSSIQQQHETEAGNSNSSISGIAMASSETSDNENEYKRFFSFVIHFQVDRIQIKKF